MIVNRYQLEYALEVVKLLTQIPDLKTRVTLEYDPNGLCLFYQEGGKIKSVLLPSEPPQRSKNNP